MHRSVAVLALLWWAGCHGGTQANSNRVTVTIPGGDLSLAQGQAHHFEASVSGATDTGVTWTASGGAISQSGDFVAPAQAGVIAVVATSRADPTASALVHVTISAAGTSSASTSSGSGTSSSASASTSSGSSSTGGTSSGAASSGSSSSGTNSGSTGGSAGGTTGAAGLLFGPYKDIGINMNWNTNELSTEVTGTSSPVTLLSVLPQGLPAVTWAFATGECGQETWAGLAPTDLASANVQTFNAAGVGYVISTGGAAGSFTCGSDSGFQTFLARYASQGLRGIDFDIEAGQTRAQIDDLVARVVQAQSSHPELRFSFTLATLAPGASGATAQSLGSSAPDPLGSTGQEVMQSISAHGLTGYFINLMVMDYGSSAQSNCVVGVGGQCDMGQSAIQAAMDLHDHYGLPYSQIELTPMIGGNDTTDETFTLADADAVAAFARQNGLGGIHFWSLDRDNDCAPGFASATCNSYGAGGTLGFTQRFLSALGL